MRLTVVGLGKLGSPLAALRATRGHRVTGSAGNPRTVEAITAGQPPVAETGLADLPMDLRPDCHPRRPMRRP